MFMTGEADRPGCSGRQDADQHGQDARAPLCYLADDTLEKLATRHFLMDAL
jgi:hypothetical protein